MKCIYYIGCALDYKVVMPIWGWGSWIFSTHFLQAILAKNSFLPCAPHTWSLHLDDASSWKLLPPSLPPAGTLCSCGTALSPHLHEGSVVTGAPNCRFPSCPPAPTGEFHVSLFWHSHCCVCTWSEQEVHEGSLQEKVKYKVLLFIYANTHWSFSAFVLPYTQYLFPVTTVLFLTQVIFRTCDIPFKNVMPRSTEEGVCWFTEFPKVPWGSHLAGWGTRLFWNRLVF